MRSDFNLNDEYTPAREVRPGWWILEGDVYRLVSRVINDVVSSTTRLVFDHGDFLIEQVYESGCTLRVRY